jgi:HlyD family secretion protein
MEIWSSVNETDIGSIHEGQLVRFTVGAFLNESFQGRVSQVRLNASMSQNVVTYTVVVAVDNSSGKLLPYLTARLQFEVESRRGVLLVPNAALRWQPRVEDVVPEARGELTTTLREHGVARNGNAAASPDGEARPGGVLWVRQGEFVRPVKVRTGLSDGVTTEIRGGGLGEGTEVVVGASRVESDLDAISILPHTWTSAAKK